MASRKILNPDLLDLIEREFLSPAIVELRRAGRCMVCHCCGLLERAAIFEIGSDRSPGSCDCQDHPGAEPTIILRGHDSFEDRGMPLLLVTAGKHNLSLSAYYEKIAGDDAASRIKAAVGDINYLLTQYGTRHGCARAASRSCSFTTEGSLLPPAPELATVLVAAVLGADRLVRSVELGPLGRREIPIADNLEIRRGPRLFGSEFV